MALLINQAKSVYLKKEENLSPDKLNVGENLAQLQVAQISSCTVQTILTKAA